MGKILVSVFVCLIAMELHGATDSLRLEVFRPYHNFRIGFGALPENYFKIEEADALAIDADIVKPDAEFYTHSLYLNYMYAPMNWLECGVYGSFASRRYRGMIYSNGIQRPSYTDLLITAMPAIRINWLRKSWVNLYSSLAVGANVHWKYQERDRDKIPTLKVQPTAQLLLIGISVGKNLYGFADFFGVGSLGLISFGVGYKLPSR